MPDEILNDRQWIYMDEAGGPGFHLSGGSSSHFILCMCIFSDHTEAAATAQSIIQAARRLDYADEFHGKKAKTSVSTEFFNSIIKHKFHVRLIFVDKSIIWSPNFKTDPKYFYRSIAGVFFRHNGGKIHNAMLYIGGDIDSRLETEIKTSVNNLTSSEIIGVQFIDSISHRLIQLADMVVTAAYKGFIKRDPRWYGHWMQLIENHLIDDMGWFY